MRVAVVQSLALPSPEEAVGCGGRLGATLDLCMGLCEGGSTNSASEISLVRSFNGSNRRKEAVSGRLSLGMVMRTLIEIGRPHPETCAAEQGRATSGERSLGRDGPRHPDGNAHRQPLIVISTPRVCCNTPPCCVPIPGLNACYRLRDIPKAIPMVIRPPGTATDKSCGRQAALSSWAARYRRPLVSRFPVSADPKTGSLGIDLTQDRVCLIHTRLRMRADRAGGTAYVLQSRDQLCCSTHLSRAFRRRDHALFLVSIEEIFRRGNLETQVWCRQDLAPASASYSVRTALADVLRSLESFGSSPRAYYICVLRSRI